MNYRIEPSRTLRGVWAGAILAVALAAAGCTWVEKAYQGMFKGTTAAVAQFHSQLNQEKYAEIYAQADPALRKSTSQSDFAALLAAVHRKLGNFENANLTNFNEKEDSQGDIVRAEYKTTFAQGSASETFTLRFTDGQGKLVKYEINSPVLIEK
jgi:Protein of unknown function (DUF4019)